MQACRHSNLRWLASGSSSQATWGEHHSDVHYVLWQSACLHYIRMPRSLSWYMEMCNIIPMKPYMVVKVHWTVELQSCCNTEPCHSHLMTSQSLRSATYHHPAKNGQSWVARRIATSITSVLTSQLNFNGSILSAPFSSGKGEGNRKMTKHLNWINKS